VLETGAAECADRPTVPQRQEHRQLATLGFARVQGDGTDHGLGDSEFARAGCAVAGGAERVDDLLERMLLAGSELKR
jgi:hypothetical protein